MQHTTHYQDRPNQSERILDLLRQGQSQPGGWVPLPEILNLRISQYSARIHGLRRRGYVIENQGTWVDGELHTRFRLVSEPFTAEPGPVEEKQISEQVNRAVELDDELEARRQSSLFGDMAPDRNRSYLE